MNAPRIVYSGSVSFYIVIIASPKLFTESEYLERQRKAAFKSEYYAGEIMPIACASRNHNRIKENLIVSIGTMLIDSNCQSFSSDMRVYLPETTMYAYPDIVIVCGEPAFMADEFDNLLNPATLTEVLSDGTEDLTGAVNFSVTAKFRRFRNTS